MTHPLTLNHGTALLLGNILSVPDHLKTTSDILLAARLIERVQVTPPEPLTKDWSDEPFGEIELTERERDLCKHVVEALVGKIPPSSYAVSLLTQLGFEP